TSMWLFSFKNLHQVFRSFNKPLRLAGGHLLAVAHAVAHRADANAGIVPAVDVVRTVSHQHSPFLGYVQAFYHMQQHARLWFQPKSIVTADDALEVLRAQSFENDMGIFNRLIGRYSLLFLCEMHEGLLHTRIK